VVLVSVWVSSTTLAVPFSKDTVFTSTKVVPSEYP
jgi:hypothetical protein